MDTGLWVIRNRFFRRNRPLPWAKVLESESGAAVLSHGREDLGAAAWGLRNPLHVLVAGFIYALPLAGITESVGAAK